MHSRRRMIWLLPLSCTQARPEIHLKTEKEIQLAYGRGGGVGEEPNHKSARKLGPLYIIQYSLYTVLYSIPLLTSLQYPRKKHYCIHVQVNTIYNEGAYLSIRKRVLDSCNNYWIIFNYFFTGTANALKSFITILFYCLITKKKLYH